jgi:uncharacterized protein (DUF697 family)
MAQGHTAGAQRRDTTIHGKGDGASGDPTAKAVRDLVRKCSLQTAALALEPVPLLDSAIFIPMQHTMVQSIARLRGHCLDGKAVRETFARIRGRLFVPNAIIALAKLITFVPVLPELVSGSVAYALTSAIGELTDRYFRRGGAMSPAEMRSSFDAIFREEFVRTYKERRDELRAMFRSPELRREIDELKHARHDGTMDPDEVARRTMEILNRHDRR